MNQDIARRLMKARIINVATHGFREDKPTLSGLLAEGNKRGYLWELTQDNDGTWRVRLYPVGRYTFTAGSGEAKDVNDAAGNALLEIVGEGE